MSLVWIDLETTGLIAAQERVLEVACVITDDQLNEVARFEAITNEARYTDFNKVDPYVLKMHADNGLWNASLLSTNELRRVDETLAELLRTRAMTIVQTHDEQSGIVNEKIEKPQLAGSTISFDRAFLDVHFRQTSQWLHYRNVDVTSFNEIARRFWFDTYQTRPRDSGTKHRAMDDILVSIRGMQHYINNLGPRTFAGEGNPNP